MASIVDENGINQGFLETPAQIERIRRRAVRIAKEVKCNDAQSLVEVGCGTGRLAWELARLLPNLEITGIDASPMFIESARKQFVLPNLTFRELIISKQKKLSDVGRWDFIVGNGILHHLVKSMESSLADFYVALKPNGKIVFWEPNIFNPYVFLIFKNSYLRKIARLDPDEMAFLPSFILPILEKVGFSNSKITYLDFLLPNTPTKLIKVISRTSDFIEQMPGLSRLSQSIFLSAQKKGDECE